MLTGEVVSDKFPYRISLFGWRLNLNRKRKKMMVILRYNFSGKRRVGGKNTQNEIFGAEEQRGIQIGLVKPTSDNDRQQWRQLLKEWEISMVSLRRRFFPW